MVLVVSMDTKPVGSSLVLGVARLIVYLQDGLRKKLQHSVHGGQELLHIFFLLLNNQTAQIYVRVI